MQQLNYLFALGAAIPTALAVLLVVDLRGKQRCLDIVSRWGLHVILFTVVVSIAITLLYSEYFGIIPCGLCWLERIALYPQLIMLGVALYVKDTYMPLHGIALSVFGLIVSLYHHYIQMGGSEFIACPSAGADCAKRFFFEFNFVTFPLLSVVLFSFLIVLYLYVLKVKNPQA